LGNVEIAKNAKMCSKRIEKDAQNTRSCQTTALSMTSLEDSLRTIYTVLSAKRVETADSSRRVARCP